MSPDDVDRLMVNIVARLLRKKRFDTSLAARAAIGAVLRMDGLRQLDVPHVWRPLLLGLQQMSKDIRGPVDNAADELADEDQRQSGFAFQRLIHLPAALNEQHRAHRIMPIDMNLHQVLELIAFKLKKSREARAAAHRFQKFVDDHPEWQEQPLLTMGEIIAGEESSAA